MSFSLVADLARKFISSMEMIRSQQFQFDEEDPQSRYSGTLLNDPMFFNFNLHYCLLITSFFLLHDLSKFSSFVASNPPISHPFLIISPLIIIDAFLEITPRAFWFIVCIMYGFATAGYRFVYPKMESLRSTLELEPGFHRSLRSRLVKTSY